MTMVFNESVNLPLWVDYYRRTAPAAALFVVDHGSDDGSTENLAGVHTIPLPRTPMDEWKRVKLIRSLQRAFLQFYDVLVYTDCDEIIVADPRVSASLEDYLAGTTYPYASPVGLNLLHISSVEGPLDASQPVLSQRRHCQFSPVMCKPLITREPLAWEPGFHTCDKPLFIDRNLYLFHTKLVDRSRALARQQISRSIEWSTEAINARHGAHHRYDDERFVREYFLDVENQVKKQGIKEFGFDAEIERVENETIEKSGVYHIQDFRGAIVRIPERFSTIF